MPNEEYARAQSALYRVKGPRFTLKQHLIAWSIFFGGIGLFYAIAFYFNYL